MKTLKFKTNIKCTSCINKVKPYFEAEPDIQQWKVDLSIPDKELTIVTDNLTEEDIISIVNKAGFTASVRKESFLSKIFG